MAERLIIRNFAGIDEIDIELGRINIFIGAQASGKSVCVKCLYFFKGVVDLVLRQAISGSGQTDELKSYLLGEFVALFELAAYQNLTFRYTDGDEFIQINGDGSSLKLTLSDFYSDLFNRARKASLSRNNSTPEEAAFLDDAIYKRFKESVMKELSPLSAGPQWFIPASRTIYSLSPEPQTASVFSTDPFLNNFRGFYNVLRKHQLFYWTDKPLITSLSKEILRADFSHEKGEDYILQLDGTKTLLSCASSGQQEVLPIILTFRHLAQRTIGPLIAYVEEPEAHLHPTTQNAVVKLMTAVFNIRSIPLQLFLTTHTPYLLTAFNNFIYAGQLADTLQNDAAEMAKLDAVVPKELRLHLADFRVYGLENGRATLMIDEETGLLRADSIDSVSDVTADQFGDLMALDPAIHS